MTGCLASTSKDSTSSVVSCDSWPRSVPVRPPDWLRNVAGRCPLAPGRGSFRWRGLAWALSYWSFPVPFSAGCLLSFWFWFYVCIRMYSGGGTRSADLGAMRPRVRALYALHAQCPIFTVINLLFYELHWSRLMGWRTITCWVREGCFPHWRVPDKSYSEGAFKHHVCVVLKSQRGGGGTESAIVWGRVDPRGNHLFKHFLIKHKGTLFFVFYACLMN